MPRYIKTINERHAAVKGTTLYDSGESSTSSDLSSSLNSSGEKSNVKIIFYSKSGCRLCDELLPSLCANFHDECLHVFKVDAVGADDVDFSLKKFPTLHFYKDGVMLTQLIQPSVDSVKNTIADMISEDF